MRFVLVALVLSVAAPAFADDLVGTWNVVMKANYSTCDAARVGDEKSEVWNVSKSGQVPLLDVRVTGGAGTTVRYLGKRDADGTVRLRNVTSGDAREVRVGSDVGVELLASPGGELRGRRVVANGGGVVAGFDGVARVSSACAIVFDITLKRQR